MTDYERAAMSRLIDRPRCDWPEIAIIGDAGAPDTVRLAANLRRAGIATATYFIPLRRQAKRAQTEDADFLLYADSLKIVDRITGSPWHLSADNPVAGALLALNCGYLGLS